MGKKYRKGIVVLSGGQDSTTCLGVALRDCAEVIAVTYKYGQKHQIETLAAKVIAAKLLVPVTVIDLAPVLENMRSSALIHGGDTAKSHPYIKDLPASFVPVRNALFLTTAFGLAMENRCDAVYTGVCQTDYSGYPDCRFYFIVALNEALNDGYQQNIVIETPLMWLTKAETFELAQDVGVLDLVLSESVTCYNGDTDTRHDWGRGCGECPACQLRANGWEEFVSSGEFDATKLVDRNRYDPVSASYLEIGVDSDSGAEDFA